MDSMIIFSIDLGHFDVVDELEQAWIVYPCK